MACSRMPKCSVRPYGSPRPHAGLVDGGDERRLALHRGVVRLGQVGRAAPQLGQHAGQRVQHVAGRLAGGHPVRVGRERRQRVVQPSGRRAAWRAGRAARRARGGRSRHAANRVVPVGAQRRRRGSATSPGVGERRRRRPGRTARGRGRGAAWWPPPPRRRGRSRAPCRCCAACGAGQPMTVRSAMIEGRSVSSRARPRAPRRAPATSTLPSGSASTLLDVPAVGRVAGADVLAERDRGVVLDRDVVVVLDDARGCPAAGARPARTPRRRCPPRGRRRRR